MDLTFTDTVDRVMAPLIEPVLEPDMDLVQTGNSASIRISVEGFHVAEPDDEAQEKLRRAFAACVRLIRFFRHHREQLLQAAAQSRPIRVW